MPHWAQIQAKLSLNNPLFKYAIILRDEESRNTGTEWFCSQLQGSSLHAHSLKLETEQPLLLQSLFTWSRLQSHVPPLSLAASVDTTSVSSFGTVPPNQTPSSLAPTVPPTDTSYKKHTLHQPLWNVLYSSLVGWSLFPSSLMKLTFSDLLPPPL